MIDKNIAKYWEQKSRKEGEIELSEDGKKKVSGALAEMKKGQTKEFETLDELVKELKQ